MSVAASHSMPQGDSHTLETQQSTTEVAAQAYIYMYISQRNTVDPPLLARAWPCTHLTIL